MAISYGMLCIVCEKKLARRDSHYCSQKCQTKNLKRKGPVQCMECMAETDTVAEAKAAGWVNVTEDPEGISYNYSGWCPDHKEWAY